MSSLIKPMYKLNKIFLIIRKNNIRRILHHVIRLMTGSLIPDQKIYLKHFENKKGLEIGGPSKIFSDPRRLPIYGIAKSVDGCNFSSQTRWEGTIADSTYKYNGKGLGKQFIGEASKISTVIKKNSKYDFIISCHSLEHIANPIEAIFEWKKALRKEGHLLIIVPDKNYNFDHRRSITTFEHILQDYRKKITEKDLTHMDEIIKNHDLSLDPGIKDKTELKKYCENNYTYRMMHHHVFNMDLLKEILVFCNMEVVLMTELISENIILARCSESSLSKRGSDD